MENKRSKGSKINILRNLTGIVGAIGQTVILLCKIINCLPYKEATLANFYVIIGYIGAIYSSVFTVLICWRYFKENPSHSIIMYILLSPFLFLHFFVTSHLIILIGNPTVLILRNPLIF